VGERNNDYELNLFDRRFGMKRVGGIDIRDTDICSWWWREYHFTALSLVYDKCNDFPICFQDKPEYEKVS
jgi:hypothetical protein